MSVRNMHADHIVPSTGVLDLIRAHKRPFLTLNACYYGLILFGMLIAMADPSIRDRLLESIRVSLESGMFAPLARAYTQGHFFTAFVLTFTVNLLLGSLLVINVPSLVIPFSGILWLSIRPVLWGICFYPVDHELGWGVYIHMGTLLLEGQGYVLAAFAAYLQGRSFLSPRSMGAVTHGEGYVLGLRHSVRLYAAVSLTLLVAAAYEAFTVIHIVPQFLPQ